MLGAVALGADGIQIGSLLAISEESSASDVYKKMVIESTEGDTKMGLKLLHPVRLLKSPFADAVAKAEAAGAQPAELEKLLGRGRAKKGIFEGNVEEGEFEAGQIAAYLTEIKPVNHILKKLLDEYFLAKKHFDDVIN